MEKYCQIAASIFLPGRFKHPFTTSFQVESHNHKELPFTFPLFPPFEKVKKDSRKPLQYLKAKKITFELLGSNPLRTLNICFLKLQAKDVSNKKICICVCLCICYIYVYFFILLPYPQVIIKVHFIFTNRTITLLRYIKLTQIIGFRISFIHSKSIPNHVL